MLKKLKYFLEDDNTYIFLVVLMMLVIAFGAGRVTALEISKISFFDTKTEKSSAEGLVLIEQRIVENDIPFILQNEDITESAVVASRNGTRYYYLHCTGVSRINEDNRIFFKSSHYARFSGYTRAANCN